MLYPQEEKHISNSNYHPSKGKSYNRQEVLFRDV